MSKEYLEALKTIKIKCHPNSNPSPLVDEALDIIEQALQRLESIDNAKPSEALECLEKNSEMFDEIALENKTSYKDGTVIEAYLFHANQDIIQQALLKAQEVEKENQKYKQLEEQIGCPLEIVFNALTNGIYIKNIDGEMVNFKCRLTYKNEELGWYFNIINGYVMVKDYKKTWWLKEDKSEVEENE